MGTLRFGMHTRSVGGHAASRGDRPWRVRRPGGGRETLEETGIECEVTGISGIYSDARHVILYTSNGEVRQELSIVLTAVPGRTADAEQ